MPKYMTPRQLAESGMYPFTRSQIYAMLFKREKNGLNHAVRKLGKNVLIRIDLFDEWLESHKETSVENTDSCDENLL